MKVHTKTYKTLLIALLSCVVLSGCSHVTLGEKITANITTMQ